MTVIGTAAEVGYLRRAHERAATTERETADELRRVATAGNATGATVEELVNRLVHAARDVGAGEVLLEVDR